MIEFEDTMLDVSWKNLEMEYQRLKDLDAKAIGVITISGILIGFLIGSSENLGSKILFVVTTFMFLVTVFICVVVLRVRSSDIFNSKTVIDTFKDKPQERQIRGTIATIVKVENSLQNVCEIKAKELKYSIITLGLAVIFQILYTISIVFPTFSSFKDYLTSLL